MEQAVGQQLIHGTAVLAYGEAILLTGPSGSGKSDLALRLMRFGGVLIADDYCEARVGQRLATQNSVMVRPPAQLKNKIELRGVGVMPVKKIASKGRVKIVIELVAADTVARMPEPATTEILGIEIPLYRLHAFHHSTPHKILAIMRGYA